MFLIGKHDTGLCQCGQLETVAHVFLECREYNAERQRLFISMAKLGVEVYSVFSLFGHNKHHQMISKAVMQFLHNTGLYERI